MAFDSSIDSNPGTMGDPRDSMGETQSDMGYSDPSTGGSYDPYASYYPIPYDTSGYTTGQESDPSSSAYSPPPTGTSFFDSILEGMKRYTKGRAMGALAQRAGAAAPLIGPAMAAFNAPEGKRMEAAGNAFGPNVLNTMLYGVNPLIGAANSIYGAFTGKTLGGQAWGAMNTGGDSSGFNQNTAASGGDPSRSGAYGGVDNLITSLAGMYGANKANNALKDQIGSLTGMYGQDSPYAQQLRSNLARKDARTGRRSQGGSREVQLQAKLAEMASRNSGAVANLEGQRNNLNMQKLNSLMYLGRQSGLFNNIGNMFSNNMTQNDMSTWGQDTGPDIWES